LEGDSEKRILPIYSEETIIIEGSLNYQMNQAGLQEDSFQQIIIIRYQMIELHLLHLLLLTQLLLLQFHRHPLGWFQLPVYNVFVLLLRDVT